MRIASRSLSASGWSFRRVKNPACCAGRKSGACPSPPSARRLATSLKPAAPRREARNILLNYARRMEHDDAGARRIVAAGLRELTHLLESLWPNQFPEELSRGTLAALVKERAPETSALLAAFLETLGRIAVCRGDFAGFENILTSLERLPRDSEHEHLNALIHRLVANDRWTLIVDAALANRALDPALPRLLQRDPERLLDRLMLLLTDPRGTEMLPAM